VVNRQLLRPRTGHGRRAGGDRERGAVLVEAAVVFPLLIFIVLGICEFGLAYRNSLTVSSASRAGARTASALARNANYATDSRDAVAAALTALPTARWQEVWIYRAQKPSDPFPGLPDSGNFTTCTNCVRFTWDTASNSWVQDPSTAWAATSQDACAGEADYVGVYVKAPHQYVTKLFGATRTLQDHTVMRFEPIPSASVCKP
jgi:hypothetical protein